MTDIERWKSELHAAGWTRHKGNIWIALNGAWYRGPYGAWKAMCEARHVNESFTTDAA